MTMRESPQGMEASIGCAAGDGMGGGIFAKTAKTPPLQSGVCGDGIAIRIAPKGRPLPPPPCAYQGRGKNPCETMRRAASLSAFTPFPLIKGLCNIHITTRHAASLRSSGNGIA